MSPLCCTFWYCFERISQEAGYQAPIENGRFLMRYNCGQPSTKSKKKKQPRRLCVTRRRNQRRRAGNIGWLQSARSPQGRRQVDSRRDQPTVQNVLKASQYDCPTPRRPLDKAHCKVVPIYINQTERVQETRTTSPTLTPICNQTICRNNDFTNDMTCLIAAQGGLKWDSVESDF